MSETSSNEPQPFMGGGKYVKPIQMLSRDLKKLCDARHPVGGERKLTLIQRIVDTLAKADLAALQTALQREIDEFADREKADMESRRETLLQAARESRVQAKRLSDYDRIGFFKVSYTKRRVMLTLGSESAGEIEETDGRKLFAFIQERADQFQKHPFERVTFFGYLKSGIALAASRETLKDGWVPIKFLYTCMALVTNVGYPEFVKRPDQRNFHSYSTAQFVYDLARFGADGWVLGDEAIRTMTPNMATVASNKVMTFPNLTGGDAQGDQAASLKIVRK
jgi:hypothetical protein